MSSSFLQLVPKGHRAVGRESAAHPTFRIIPSPDAPDEVFPKTSQPNDPFSLLQACPWTRPGEYQGVLGVPGGVSGAWPWKRTRLLEQRRGCMAA